MNFIEAVQELKDGRCEGIKRTSKRFIVTDGLRLHDIDYMPDYEEVIAEDWELVDPKPQTEAVTVKRLYCPGCARVFISPNESCGCNKNTAPLVELIGTYEREVKLKVKHREEISRPKEFIGPIQDHESFPRKTKFYAEWEE